MTALLLSLWLAVSITTAHFDNSRNNANLAETKLTPVTVTSGKFGLRGGFSVDGFVFAQPLVVENIVIGGRPRDVLFTCTMHDSCYAFDANLPNSAALWHAGPLATSRTSYPFQGSNTFLYGAEVGCLATPAIDTANNLMFVVCTNSTPTWVLYKLNLLTGATISSIVITGQVPGTGDPSGGDCLNGANVVFCPAFTLLRSAVTLSNNRVYLFFGSYDDQSPGHGWAIAYDEALSQVGLFCTTPSGHLGSFWGGGGGPSVDAGGNLYDVTGNGDWDGISAFADSFLKFDSSLNLIDWFTPANHAAMSAADLDLASNRTLLIPGTGLLLGGGKDFRVWVLNTSNMGHLQGGGGIAPAQFVTNPSGTTSDFSGSYGMMMMNNLLYMPTTGGAIYSFAFNPGTKLFNTTPIVSSATFAFPGAATLAGSSNGASNGILWTATVASSAYSTSRAGTLRALNPSDMSEYWNSGTSGHDTLGTFGKYASPTVANGKVFVATLDSKVQVFGLSAASQLRGAAAIRGQAGIR